MSNEASSGSGKTNYSVQLQPIEVQLALNRHAGYNQLAAIAGSPYFDSYLYSQKLPFLNLSFHHDFFFKYTWDWTLAEIRDCLFSICHELQLFKIRGVRRLPVTDWTPEQRLPFRFSLFELSRWKSVHIIIFKILFFRGPNIQVSQNVVNSALEASWILAYSRKSGIQVGGSCRSSADLLTRNFTLRFTLPSCRSIMEPERHKLFYDLGNVRSKHTSWSKSS